MCAFELAALGPLAHALLDPGHQGVDELLAERGALLAAAEEHADQVLVLLRDVEQHAVARAQRAEGTVLAGRSTLLPGPQGIERRPHDLAEELLLVAEVQVEGARRDAGAAGDLGAGDAVQTVVGEELGPRLHQPTARLAAATGAGAVAGLPDFGLSD